MAQADDIKELQAQVKDLTERLAKLETAEPAPGYNDEELVKRIAALENVEPIEGAELIAAPLDDSRLATLEAQVEKIRVHTNAP
jgi:septal ring factor EnvC (AmiA/AmiB activator)